MKTLNERLDLIKSKILSDSFRAGKGLGNEINFWIFDYDAEDELAVRSHISYLQDTIKAEREDVRLVVYDLFDIMVDYLNEKKYLKRTLEMEKSKKSGAIINPIKKTLRSTLPDDIVASRIAENSNPETDIILITGVGKAWPVYARIQY
jgi:hypothetical protein